MPKKKRRTQSDTYAYGMLASACHVQTSRIKHGVIIKVFIIIIEAGARASLARHLLENQRTQIGIETTSDSTTQVLHACTDDLR
jgi:hypothetical protein